MKHRRRPICEVAMCDHAGKEYTVLHADKPAEKVILCPKHAKEIGR